LSISQAPWRWRGPYSVTPAPPPGPSIVKLPQDVRDHPRVVHQSHSKREPSRPGSHDKPWLHRPRRRASHAKRGPGRIQPQSCPETATTASPDRGCPVWPISHDPLRWAGQEGAEWRWRMGAETLHTVSRLEWEPTPRRGVGARVQIPRLRDGRQPEGSQRWTPGRSSARWDVLDARFCLETRRVGDGQGEI